MSDRRTENSFMYSMYSQFINTLKGLNENHEVKAQALNNNGRHCNPLS